MLGSGSFDPKKGVEVATVAARDLYSVALRVWGLRITVTDDPTPANNVTYVLVQGFSDDNKSNNSNWQAESSANASVTQTAGDLGAGGRILHDGNKRIQEYIAVSKPAYIGGNATDNILQASLIPDLVSFRMEVYVEAIQTSGTPGSSGWGLLLRRRFRKGNDGLLVALGASVLVDSDNDTGDGFVGTPNIDAGAGGNVNLNFNQSTVKHFSVTAFVKLTMTD